MEIRWGILGTGKIAHKFAESLKHVANAKLVAIGSRNIDGAKVFAQKFGAPHAFGSYEELAASLFVDVIYIATPHVFHCSNTLLCLENGKAVLCEKPFAMDTDEVSRMIEKAREKKLFLMEAMWTRFFPSFIKVQNLINSGAIGDVVHIRADFGFKALVNPDDRLYNKALGGGALLDIGIYPVFLAYMIFGYPEKITTNSIIGFTGVDESIVMNFYYKNGAVASLYSTLLVNTAVEADIFGTKGYIKMHRRWHHANEITIGELDGKTEVIKFPTISHGYEYEAQEVTNCLLAGKLQSEMFPLHASAQLIKLLDTIREMNQISYK